jgi:hypothetical protein
MKVATLIQSRLMSDGDIAFVRELIEQNANWSRYRLSRELAERWNWRNGNGQIKEIDCRNLLRKLDEKGLIRMPTSKVHGIFPLGFIPIHSNKEIHHAAHASNPLVRQNHHDIATGRQGRSNAGDLCPIRPSTFGILQQTVSKHLKKNDELPKSPANTIQPPLQAPKRLKYLSPQPQA